MNRHWSEIPSYEWQDPNWGATGCDGCGEYEGEYVTDEGELCEKCYKALNERDKEPAND